MYRESTIVRTIRLSLLCIVVLAAVTPRSARSQAFADNGYSAGITSMGRSVASLSGDPAMLFYNPAANGFGSDIAIGTSYTNLYPDLADGSLNFIALAGAVPVSGIGVFSLGATQFGPKGWHENVIAGGYALPLLDDALAVGGAVKLLRWSADAPSGENAVPEGGLSFTGFSVDAGAEYVFRDIVKQNDLRFGVAILNINKPSVAVSGSPDAALPMEVNGGAAYVSHVYDYTVSANVGVIGSEMRIALGAEVVGLRATLLGVDGAFILRAGGRRLTAGDAQGEYDAGVGVVAGSLRIDYAYSSQVMLTHVGGINTVSLGYAFH